MKSLSEWQLSKLSGCLTLSNAMQGDKGKHELDTASGKMHNLSLYSSEFECVGAGFDFSLCLCLKWW